MSRQPSLIDIVRRQPGRLVVPLMGYPGARLTESSLKQNEFNWGLQYRSIEALVRRFQPDAAFFFMDLSLEAGAFGLPVRFPLEESATVEEHPVQSLADLRRLRTLDPMEDGRIHVYVETMRQMSQRLDVLRGGYVVGPFTLAGLLMGANALALATVDDIDLVHSVLDFCQDVILRYAKALVTAGADLICFLEPTAVILSPAAFHRFSGQYVKRIIEVLDTVPILHVCGDTTRLVGEMCATGAQGLSLDSAVDLAALAQEVPSDVVLMGNLDPVRVLVNLDPAGVRQATRQLLEAMAPYPNFILSTGCDLPAETPLENVQAMMDEARQGQPAPRGEHAGAAR